MAYEGIKQAFGQFVSLVGASYSQLSEPVKQKVAEFLEVARQKLSTLKGRPVTAPIPDAARLLWELAGRNPEPFARYLQQLPSPELQSIVTNPGLLAQTIQNLQREMPLEQLGQLDGLPQAWLNSSNVAAYSYDQGSGKLKVKFHNGGLYEYSGVPKEIYELFNSGAIPARTDGKNEYGKWWKGKVPSLGASLHWLVKAGGFPYKKLK